MEMIFRANVLPIERRVVSSLLTFLTLWSHFQRGNSLNTLNSVSTEGIQKLLLSTTEGGSTTNITFMGTVSEYKVSRKFDFFIPDVDVVCQCSCADSDTLSSCRFDEQCAYLVNSTTTCTIYNIIDSGYSFCNKFYKLCCQVYFTKTKFMKLLKALYLKYHQTLLNLKIISKSDMSKPYEYNVTVTNNIKHILVSPDKVLHVSVFAPVHPIPESWYFIEEGSNELQYADAMNGKGEKDLNKIGWFQHSVRENRLSQVSVWKLKDHLKVKLLDCLSNPPKYEWKLNATYYVRKGLMHLPTNVEKVSELYKNILKISVDLIGEKIKMGVINPTSVNISLSNANLHPFLFTSTIKDTVLNLTFTKRNGTFNVKITSPHWTDVFSFSTGATEKIIKLPDKKYDSSWVCVSQKSQELCQMPSLVKHDVRSVITSTATVLNEIFPIEMINSNVTDFPTNASSSIAENSSNTVVVITATTVSAFILITSLLVIIILWRRRQRKIKMRDAIDEMEMEPLSSNNTSPTPRSTFTKFLRRIRYSRIQGRIEEGQRDRYQRIELPQVNWTNRDLPLEELYVNLELLTSSDAGDESNGQEIKLEEMFREINGKKPVRILIEGGPGYGKTTLCAKLLSDWGQRKNYISSKFKMVFLFELRYFKENYSIESELKRECEAVGVNGDEGIRCVEAFEKETLLILDGFDEMSEECKKKFIPLFQKNVYRSMFILVTSRRGLFRVEKKIGSEHVGVLQKKNDIENVVDVWGKRVLIKGVTTDKIESFMRKYLQKDYQELEGKINSITGGEMGEVFQCPLFLILLAMMLEERPLVKVNTKTTLYKEFFNFVVRRNLIREKKLSDDEEVDIFNESCKSFIVELLHQFGRFSTECLCESKLLFEESEILQYCEDETVLKLGFLMKIPKMERRKRENFYQPIHKSFLEFAAAFATWNLVRDEQDEQEFKKEMERIAEKGLKPSEDSLFYFFLTGLMNSQASVLFQSLIHYNSWFNIVNPCFTDILLEIQNIHSFFVSFQPILDSFVPSIYSIPGDNGLTRDYFLSDIHSLILKHASDRQVIKLLDWNSKFCINLSRELHFDCLQFNLTDEIFKLSSKEKIIPIKSKNVIYRFTESFTTNQWNDFVSLFNSIQSEKVHFLFEYRLDETNSHPLNLLHKELVEGRWKQKNIDRLRFRLNTDDDPRSLSLLLDLVKKKRIKEGIYLCIGWLRDRKENEINFLKTETEELFNSILQSKTIQEFVFFHYNDNFTPDIEMNRILNSHLKRLTLDGIFNILKPNENKKENCSMEEVNIVSGNDENDFKFIQYFQETKCLSCSINRFNSLLKFKWSGLKVIEELQLNYIDYKLFHLFLNSVSQLINLQVLSLDVDSIKTNPSNSDQRLFVHFFSSLRLRICEFIFIYKRKLFSFLMKALMEGMKKKEEEEEENINPTMDSNDGKKVYLQELVIGMGFYKLKECNGIESIRTMLRNQHLKQCCFFSYYNSNDYIKPKTVLNSLFPSKDNFRMTVEVEGMNPNNSRRSQFQYRWFEFENKFCITYVE